MGLGIEEETRTWEFSKIHAEKQDKQAIFVKFS